MRNLVCIALLFWTCISHSQNRSSAQFIITPGIGINLAGDLEFRRGGFGGSIGYLGKKIGVEIEYMRHHHYFKDSKIGGVLTGGPTADKDSDAQIFTTNFLFPFYKSNNREWKLYGSAGIGLYNAWIESRNNSLDSKQTDMGIHIGAGVWYSVSKRIRLRNDLRYSTVFAENNTGANNYTQNYGFLRFTLGLSYSLNRDN